MNDELKQRAEAMARRERVKAIRDLNATLEEAFKAGAYVEEEVLQKMVDSLLVEVDALIAEVDASPPKEPT